jgi:ribosomal-protein-alanine N-acetyltransferase
MRELVNNLGERSRLGSFEIVSADEDCIETIKNIETRCNLSPWSVDDYKMEITRDDSVFIVAKVDGEVIGFTLARLITNSDNKNHTTILKEIEFYNIAVNPGFQNLGVGQTLLKHLLLETIERGVSIAWLEVRESNNAAIQFYEKNGFKPVYIRNNFYSSPSENAIVMRLEIPTSDQISDD